jgi:hypothetical protein
MSMGDIEAEPMKVFTFSEKGAAEHQLSNRQYGYEPKIRKKKKRSEIDLLVEHPTNSIHHQYIITAKDFPNLVSRMSFEMLTDEELVTVRDRVKEIRETKLSQDISHEIKDLNLFELMVYMQKCRDEMSSEYICRLSAGKTKTASVKVVKVYTHMHTKDVMTLRDLLALELTQTYRCRLSSSAIMQIFKRIAKADKGQTVLSQLYENQFASALGNANRKLFYQAD